jgi:hypothetical protein
MKVKYRYCASGVWPLRQMLSSSSVEWHWLHARQGPGGGMTFIKPTLCIDIPSISILVKGNEGELSGFKYLRKNTGRTIDLIPNITVDKNEIILFVFTYYF